MLEEKASSITSHKDLAQFVRDLLADLETNRNDWENPTLERFLEAMSGWLDSADGFYANQGLPMPQKLEWKDVAGILLAARIYE
jgi:hypothetical protein